MIPIVKFLKTEVDIYSLIIIIFCILDITATSILILIGEITEGMPWLRWIFENYGLVSMVLVKLFFNLLCVFLLVIGFSVLSAKKRIIYGLIADFTLIALLLLFYFFPQFTLLF
jgi:hypothetical protein